MTISEELKQVTDSLPNVSIEISAQYCTAYALMRLAKAVESLPLAMPGLREAMITAAQAGKSDPVSALTLSVPGIVSVDTSKK